MGALLSVSRAIDGVIGVLGKIGAWASLLLVLLVCYDVVSRYFGVPKPFGLNSTMIQEGEYWLHTFLFALFIGYAYTRQAHVRIDLFRERLPRRGKYAIRDDRLPAVPDPLCRHRHLSGHRLCGDVLRPG